MSLAQILPIGAASEAPRRDATIDAVRAACLLVVVILHALMVGVELAPGGGLRTSVALSGQSWFTPFTWLLQIMPLYFIAGGFASLSQWRRMRAGGAGTAEYVVGRIRRLTIPAVMMIATVGGVLLLAKLAGADPALITEASLRIGQPLWFLAVYLGVTALVPVMAWLHERHRVITIVVLGLVVLAVDVGQSRWGLPIGYLNLAFAWLLMQQLGFIMLDGGRAAWSRRQVLAGMFSALALLFVLIACGWSSDMLLNLNPPTLAMVLLGTVQFFVLQLLRPRLDIITRIPLVEKLAAKAGSYAMGVYLWHMPIVLLLVAILWLTGLPLPAPYSGVWWATRIPWLLVIAVCVLPFSSLVARLENLVLQATNTVAARNHSTTLAGNIGAALSALLAIAGTASALLLGIAEPMAYLLAVGLLSIGIVLAIAGKGQSSSLGTLHQHQHQHHRHGRTFRGDLAGASSAHIALIPTSVMFLRSDTEVCSRNAAGCQPHL